jgi:hypothetical protein
MAHSRIIPKLKDCKAYIEGCGWQYSHKSILNQYVFIRPKQNTRPTRYVAFTLTQIRDAYLNGW